MGKFERIPAFIARTRDLWITAVVTGGTLELAWWLSHVPAWRDPLLYNQLQFASGILALTFATAELVRFRATSDRMPLVLASGFTVVGFALAAPSVLGLHLSESEANALVRAPTAWVISRTFLGLLLVAALVVEKRLPTARNTAREITVALVLVGACTAAFAIVHVHLPSAFVVSPRRFFPRLGDLVPASIFVVAAVQYRHRLRRATFPSDHALFYAAALNVGCSVAASLSGQLPDAPFVLAEILQFSSYAVLLGGAFLDDIQLFENVHRLSVSDPLTRLANYRKLLDAIEGEIQRSGRTGRPFGLVLLDLDGLKQLNDQYGHLTGSRALCRVANALRFNSRSIDTCARYGGDEFALVLPETAAPEAQDAARRVCARVAEDPEEPHLSVSAGIATYPSDGEGVESLIQAADHALYGSKQKHVLESHPRSKN